MRLSDSATRAARRADGPIAAFADEIDDLADIRIVGEFLLDVREPLLQRALRAEQRAIGAPQLVDRLARKAATRQPDDVEAAKLGAVADGRARTG